MAPKNLDRDQRDQLAKLADLPDSEIDTSDIPEAPVENWIWAYRGANRSSGERCVWTN